MARVRSVVVASAVLLAVVSAAGCGSSSSGGVLKSRSASASVTPLDAGDLQARLLTLNEMPAGFTADTDSTNTNGTVSSPDPGCTALADLLTSDGKPAGAVAEAEASFTRSQLGPDIVTGVASFPSASAAQSVLDTVATAIHRCTKLTETDKEGSRYEFRVAQLSFPAAGDASGAIRMSADIGGYPAQVDVVLARIGSTLLYVVNTGLGDTDSDLTQDVVARAVAKVRDPELPVARTPGAAPSSTAP